MQRYRVNLPLLIGLVVGAIALTGGSYGLYRFQKSRNASRLLERQDAALAAGDTEQAVKLLVDYLRLRPGDEEAMSRLATTLAEVAEGAKAEPKDIRDAIGQLEATVRDFPQRDDLRRRLVDLYMSRRLRMLKPAQEHVSQLLNRNPNDPELHLLLSECRFASSDAKALDHAYQLIGFDTTTEEFDTDKALAPHEPAVYSRIARMLRNDMADERLADRMIAQMIEANPESGEAYLARAQYVESIDGKEAALPDVRKALELDPDDPSIVMANARAAAQDKEFDRARDLLEASLTEHPDEALLYQGLSDIEVRQGELVKALEVVDRGIAAVPVEQSQMLMFQKARLQLQSDSPEDVRATIRAMREKELMPSVYPDYFEARLKMSDGEWFEAAQAFEKYQTYLANFPLLGVELNVMLGICREKLGQDELAIDAFNQALQLEPDNLMADQGRRRVMQKVGRQGRENEGVSIYAALGEELAKPDSQQDWQAFDKLCVDYVENMKLGDAMLAILRGEVFMRRGMYPEAREKLIEAYKLEPKNLGVRRAAVKLFAADPDQGPAKALALLDKVVEDFGDMPILRLERADLLSVINDEDLTEQLFSLTEGTEDWSDREKEQLWKGLAEKFGRLRNDEARSECLRKVAELSPNDLPTLLEMFTVALAANDAPGVEQAQKRVLDIVGSKENATWMFTEASRLLAEWRASGGEGDGIQRASELVDRAISQRREWHELHNLKADILLSQRKIREALASYDRAAELGRQDAKALYQYIKLLMARGRYADALEQLTRINRESRLRLLGRDYAECLLRLGKGAEGVVAAREFAEQAPNNAAMQLWLGRYLAQASERDDVKQIKDDLVAESGEALSRVVEIDPSSAEGWLALVGHYKQTGDAAKADDVTRLAQLALVEDQSQLVLARCYELVGRTIDAEALYTQALERASDADRPRVAQMLAQFYLGPAYRRPDQLQKATPLINQILRDAVDGRVTPDSPIARWARSVAARLLARSGEYQDLRNAELLIASNADEGALPVEDRLLMAEILAPRPEPVSRMKAARLLEEIGQNQQLSKKSELELGRLYFALDKWRECREQMLNIIGKHPEDAEVRSAYIEMLLQRGGSADVDRAVRQVKQLQKIAPNSLATRELLARIAFEKGKKEEASRALLSMLPRDVSKLTTEQLPLIKRIAQRLVSFDDGARAQKLFELAAKIGGVGEKFTLAQYIGEKVDANQGLDLLEELKGDLSNTQLVQGGIAVIRGREASGEEVSPDLIARVESWLDRGLREDPDLISLQLQQAELLDFQRDYDKAADVYRKLLDRPDLKGMSRAVVLNNLAYLLALSKPEEASISEADRYVSEAVDLLGPGTEILDTRAVIAIADKRYDDAIADLRLAVIDRPTASKYFHLATSLALIGREEEASEAWRQAVDRGLTRESTSQLERDQYDEIKRRIESAGLTNVSS